MEEYPLECIRCKYILKQITEHLTKNKLLKIINYNKLIQNELDIGIIDYKKYYEQIEIELIPINIDNKKYFIIMINIILIIIYILIMIKMKKNKIILIQK